MWSTENSAPLLIQKLPQPRNLLKKAGEFHLLFEKTVQSIKADMPLLKTEQLSEKEILEISRGDKQIRMIVRCPECNKRYKTTKYSGERIECPNCKKNVVLYDEER